MALCLSPFGFESEVYVVYFTQHVLRSVSFSIKARLGSYGPQA